MNWQPASSAPEDGLPFLAYGKQLVDEDFTPDGIVEACWKADHFVGALWDNCHDAWKTERIEFTHWARPRPPVPPDDPDDQIHTGDDPRTDAVSTLAAALDEIEAVRLDDLLDQVEAMRDALAIIQPAIDQLVRAERNAFSDKRPSFEIRDPEIETVLHQIADRIKAAVPVDWTFAVFLNQVSPPHMLFYLSSGDRADTIVMLQRWISRQQS